MADKEQDNSWMYAIFNNAMIKEKSEQWTKEADEAGMTLTEYLESISPLNNGKSEDKEQETKTGHWIYDKETDLAICSECGSYCPHDNLGRIETYSCPDCGARMIEPQESEE